MKLEQAYRFLAVAPPPVVLVLAPDIQALWDMGLGLSREWGLSALDFLPLWRPSADDARNAAEFSQFAPGPGAQHRLVLVNLDHASEQAQNILLKVLEEPPPRAVFLLVGSRQPLPTVLSRAHVIKVGLHTREPAYDVAAWDAAKPAVAAGLKAAMSGDQQALETVLRHWEPAHTIMLGAWALEASMRRWNYFDQEFAPGATHEHARSVLVALSEYQGARTAGAVALNRLQEGEWSR